MRLAHVREVGRRGAEAGICLGGETEPFLFPLACLLHDVGRALDPEDVDVHALVGARFLQQAGVPAPVVVLVAHHSGARFEANLRGVRDELEAIYPYKPWPALAALSYLDATTGPDGETISAEERLEEIGRRHGVDSWQYASFELTLPEIAQGATIVHGHALDQ